MSSRLKFKGETTTKKKRRRVSPSGGGTEQPSTSQNQIEGWTLVPDLQHAFGPLFLVQPGSSDRDAVCLAVNPSLNSKIFPHIFEDPESPARFEPADIHHVFVCMKLPDSHTEFTLKSATGRFLAIDQVGSLIADREAFGPQEQFTMIPHPTMPGHFCIQSTLYNTFLSIDQVAGGKLEFRGDVKEADLGQDEAFEIKMQGRNLGEYEKRLQKEQRLQVEAGLMVVKDVQKAEMDAIRNNHTRGMGRLVASQEDTRELKKARKEGDLHESMLDRRMKLKQQVFIHVCVVD